MRGSLFLTSNFGGTDWSGKEPRPTAIEDDHGLATLLRERWPEAARCLWMASDPASAKETDFFAGLTAEALALSGLPVACMDVCDDRHRERAARLKEYEVIFLSGGHVPTEHAFFEEIGLRELLQDFEGLVIGISAGTMNSAEMIYAPPEEEGEALDPDYALYLPGLGLTQINVVPHFQKIVGESLDGLRIWEDMLVPDSFTRPFFALPDGSFILEEDGEATLFGPGFWVENGEIEELGAPEGLLL